MAHPPSISHDEALVQQLRADPKFAEAYREEAAEEAMGVREIAQGHLADAANGSTGPTASSS